MGGTSPDNLRLAVSGMRIIGVECATAPAGILAAYLALARVFGASDQLDAAFLSGVGATSFRALLHTAVKYLASDWDIHRAHVVTLLLDSTVQGELSALPR
jgi:hypothetical protein